MPELRALKGLYVLEATPSRLLLQSSLPSPARAPHSGCSLPLKGSAPRRPARSYGQLGPGPASWPP